MPCRPAMRRVGVSRREMKSSERQSRQYLNIAPGLGFMLTHTRKKSSWRRRTRVSRLSQPGLQVQVHDCVQRPHFPRSVRPFSGPQTVQSSITIIHLVFESCFRCLCLEQQDRAFCFQDFCFAIVVSDWTVSSDLPGYEESKQRRTETIKSTDGS